MNKFTYFFYRKYKQVKNVIRWIPVIWNNFDFDYRYALEAFKFQLNNIADHMESDKAVTMSAADRAQKIRTITKLMDKVYDEEYATDYIDKIEELYGPREINWEDDDEKEGYVRYEGYIYEREYTPEQLKAIKEHETKLHKEGRAKQEKAHKLLWKLMEHNIRGFWD